MELELREVEVFLVLAEELHFGRTAERLYLSQSRISQTIRVLEGRFGGRLFERTSRRVRLSPLGQQLRDGLGPAFEEIHRVAVAARDTAAGVSGELRITAASLPAAGPLMARVIDVFEERHPGCRVVFRDQSTLNGLAGLRRGDVHLIAAWLPLDEPDMTIGPTLTEEERALAVRDGHPLAGRGHATVQDLADHSVVDPSTHLPAVTADAWVPRKTPDGRPIERRYGFTHVNELLTWLARGAIVHPTVTSMGTYHSHPGMSIIPLRGLPRMRSALVWRAGAETAAILAFAKVAEELIHEAGA